MSNTAGKTAGNNKGSTCQFSERPGNWITEVYYKTTYYTGKQDPPRVYANHSANTGNQASTESTVRLQLDRSPLKTAEDLTRPTDRNEKYQGDPKTIDY